MWVRGGNQRRGLSPGFFAEASPGDMAAIEQQPQAPGTDPAFVYQVGIDGNALYLAAATPFQQATPTQTAGLGGSSGCDRTVPPFHSSLSTPSYTSFHGLGSPLTSTTTAFFEHTNPNTDGLQPETRQHVSAPVQKYKRVGKGKSQAFSVYWECRQAFEAIQAHIDTSSIQTLVNPTTAELIGCKATPLQQPLMVGNYLVVSECFLLVRCWVLKIQQTQTKAYILDSDSCEFNHIRFGSEALKDFRRISPGFTARQRVRSPVPPQSIGANSTTTTIQDAQSGIVPPGTVYQSAQLMTSAPLAWEMPAYASSVQISQPNMTQDLFNANALSTISSTDGYGSSFNTGGYNNSLYPLP